MQKYKLLKQGKDCALYGLRYDDDTNKYLVKDTEGDVLAMAVTRLSSPPSRFVELVDTYDLRKVHAERRAEHKKWEKQFVEK